MPQPSPSPEEALPAGPVRSDDDAGKLLVIEGGASGPGCYTFRTLGLALDTTRIPAAKAMLAHQGVSEWARANGFRPKSVHDVLSGKRACIRGNSHRIARALGLIKASIK